MTRFACLVSTCALLVACGDEPPDAELDASPGVDAGLDDFTAEERALLLAGTGAKFWLADGFHRFRARSSTYAETDRKSGV